MKLDPLRFNTILSFSTSILVVLLCINSSLAIIDGGEGILEPPNGGGGELPVDGGNGGLEIPFCGEEEGEGDFATECGPFLCQECFQHCLPELLFPTELDSPNGPDDVPVPIHRRLHTMMSHHGRHLKEDEIEDDPFVKCVVDNGCSEELIYDFFDCAYCHAPPEDFNYNWDEFANFLSNFTCNNTEAPSSVPSVSFVPSLSVFPSKSPSKSPAPSVSMMPSESCICPDCTHTSGCNPDPHYISWDNSYFDFQGGCDQIAVDNQKIQIQIRTRPRGGYSAITQVVVLFKGTGEFFHVGIDSGVLNNTLTSASGVTYNLTSPYSYDTHEITFDGLLNSFILINEWYSSLSVQISGHGSIFCNSEGMFGSWNYGGVRFPNGTQFDLSGGWSGTRTRSIELAQAWMIPFDDNLLTDPSTVCDASASCGGIDDEFDCFDTRRKTKRLGDGTTKGTTSGSSSNSRSLQVSCNTTDCSHIEIDYLRSACEEDLLITGDNSWTCQPTYVNPVIADVDECDFVPLTDEKCYTIGNKCELMGGECRSDCVDTDTHICIPGFCGDVGGGEIRFLKAKADKQTKAPKGSQPPEALETECMCYAPIRCG